ncbi:XTP/dITP diphosphatase [Dehalogenimonas etheniformans]|uniref:dITP/XTP pyrophosphatase n=1 Tax=Dehalogenimonas etheniformans TaxID=1536648 RepID=A0A2P5P8W5_9CHLR|nr:XTP/dITP diphosphatase [Dehalogenimonas etheniformans]PPD58730.1 XTP/dITP diphosphatase [Dehalogenimonas etheniformans]QNT76501.1 XTP/dITP diphosphatase [Dehalogenimonas etheniformans]
MKPELMLATNNRGKIGEYRDLLSGCGYELVTPAQKGISIEVAETGGTFTENAALKARALASTLGLLTLADDSGLEVDALGGDPGVHSARYAGDNATDSERIDLLLKNLEGVPSDQRTARFRCVIAIADPAGEVRFAEGRIEGLISFAPRGHYGFGYDPVFYLSDRGKTMAELPVEEKNRISHRAFAAAKACLMLKSLSKISKKKLQ